MPATCSGLSALIQAATSQLGLLAETADLESEGSHLTSIEGGYGSAGSEMAPSPQFGPSRPTMIVPEHEHTNGKLSFPEQLMTLLMDPKNEDVVTFLPDGKYFAIRRREFTDDLLYKHFHLTTFAEFLELIRGWGFARINGNNGNGGGEDVGSDSIEPVDEEDCSTQAIHVFRHPHFRRNHPVDMKKLRFGSKKHAHQAIDTARVIAAIPSIAKDGGTADTCCRTSEPGMVEKIVSDDLSMGSSKRRLSPSHVTRDEDVIMREQRVRHNSHDDTSMDNSAPSIVASLPQSHESSNPPQPRRSSIELRGAAEAIASSKLKLHTTEAEEDVENNIDINIPAPNNASGRRRQERRSSTASLVDGGVEAATHTIVTDAIETLLFDEKHTRETFKKHEQELSTSSLPGVVPISKQLFDGEPRSPSAAASIANTAISVTPASASTSSPKQPTKSTFTISNVLLNPNATMSDLEGASSGTSRIHHNVLETTGRHPPSSSNGTHHTPTAAAGAGAPRKVTTDMKDAMETSEATTSPSRMEAAAALMSQARQSTIRFAENGSAP